MAQQKNKSFFILILGQLILVINILKICDQAVPVDLIMDLLQYFEPGVGKIGIICMEEL
jgi:hypothetical protein